MITIISDSGTFKFNARHMKAMFELIDIACADCAIREINLRSIVGAEEFAAEFARNIDYLRARNEYTQTREPASKTYQFLLGRVRGKEYYETMEQYFARIGSFDLLKLRYELAGANFDRSGVLSALMLGGDWTIIEWALSIGC